MPLCAPASVRRSSLVMSEQSKRGGVWGSECLDDLDGPPAWGRQEGWKNPPQVVVRAPPRTCVGILSCPFPRGPCGRATRVRFSGLHSPGQALSSGGCCSVPTASHFCRDPLLADVLAPTWASGSHRQDSCPWALRGCGCSGLFLDGGHTRWICSLH